MLTSEEIESVKRSMTELNWKFESETEDGFDFQRKDTFTNNIEKCSVKFDGHFIFSSLNQEKHYANS